MTTWLLIGSNVLLLAGLWLCYRKGYSAGRSAAEEGAVKKVLDDVQRAKEAGERLSDADRLDELRGRYTRP